MPQPPQLALSVVVSTHLEPQSVEPTPQLCAQTPPMQACPVGHAVPHAPQLSESVSVS
jgi:hypothetical protein